MGEGELGPKNDIRYREVSGIKFPLHKGFCCESLIVILSVLEKSVRCREVFALKHVRCKGLSLCLLR